MIKRGLVSNNRGLSAVVTTLIIILLVLVAVGIIWVVVRGVVESGAEQIELSTQCNEVSLKAISVVPVTSEIGNYTVTLKREGSFDGELGGVKVNLFNDTDSSGVIDFGITIGLLETENQKIATTLDGNTLLGANRMEYTPYFLDGSGAEQTCPQQTNEYEFN